MEKKERGKVGILFIIGFLIYIVIEVLWTGLIGEMVGFQGKTYLTFGGFSTVWMGLLGGALFLILGKFNERKRILRNTPLFVQALIGGLVITALELLVGIVLNLWFGLHIWDYSSLPLNFLGQINIINSVLWVLLSPFAFWVDDTVRWVFYRLGACRECNGLYNIFWYYKQLFSLQPPKFKELSNEV